MRYDHFALIPPSHRDARFDKPSARLYIPKTKTGTRDRPGRVVFFTEFHEGVEGCPFKSWQCLKRKRRGRAKTIFHWRNGDPISRDDFNLIVRGFMDAFGKKKRLKPETISRLSWYTFRISLFVFLGLNCDLSIELMRAIGGWSKTSEMPAHYQAKGRLYQGISASVAASNLAGTRVPSLNVDPLLDKKWRNITLTEGTKPPKITAVS